MHTRALPKFTVIRDMPALKKGHAPCFLVLINSRGIMNNSKGFFTNSSERDGLKWVVNEK